MVLHSEKKACNACRKAKQKCGKQDPQCTRCVERSLECAYPSPKGGCWIPVQDISTPVSEHTAAVIFQDPSLAGIDMGTMPDASCELDPSPIDSESLSTPETIWFLRPETWDIRHSARLENRQYTSMALKQHVKWFRLWLSEWVRTAENPFIHSHIYRHHIPRCVQDAYSTIALYDQKTAANEETISRIIAERVSALFDDYHLATLNAYDILARVHALLVYQIIRLYDGDIRLRHDAEEHIPVLETWAHALMNTAASSAGAGTFLTMANIDEVAPTLCGLEAPDRSMSEVLWNAWILAESVRRAWMMTASLKTIYFAMMKGWAPCPGGVMWTTRKGVWGAQSALSWNMMCSGTDIGFMHRDGTEKLFVDSTPDEVDDFAKAVMTISFGSEKISLWEIESRRKSGLDGRRP